MSNRAAHIVLFLILALGVVAQVPPRPDPPRLVNDLAGILDDTRAMEDSLQAFAVRTGNQIVVVTLTDLGNWDKAMMAYQIGQQWGVGGKKNNNGVVILIKPKTGASKGQAFIATGYGLEGGLTDAFCTRVVNREMIPHFRQNDYAAGVWAALRVVVPVVEGEYSEREYLENDGQAEDISDIIAFIVIFLILLLYIYSKRGDDSGNNNRNTGTWGGPIIFTGWDSGSSGGWGSSSGGSGWGGFGGGSFGGGGGGGSW